MKFTMWTWYHYLYIISPFILAAIVFLLVKDKSSKTQRITLLIFAVINVAILFIRNLDILLRLGRMDAELIPLGPCHFANIIFFIAAFTKKQEWYNLAWCLNLPFGFLAIVFCDSLENYATMLAIRPMAYIWGHMFLISSIIYAFLIGCTKFNKSTFKKSLSISGIWLCVSLITNILYVIIGKGSYGTANYMYLITPESGTPLTILYNLHSGFTIGAVDINPLYIVLLSIVGIVLFFLFFVLHQALARFVEPKKVSAKVI